MKIWIVESGAYENRGIDKVFASKDQAVVYVIQQELAAAAKPRRSMDDCWNVDAYEIDDVDTEITPEIIRDWKPGEALQPGEIAMLLPGPSANSEPAYRRVVVRLKSGI